MPEPLTGPQALALLRQVVAERPDHVYVAPDGEGCRYVHDGQPSCLVGHVLHRHGIPLDWFASWEGTAATALSPVWADSDAARILETAQYAQDVGATWGTALEAAEAAAHIDVTAAGDA